MKNIFRGIIYRHPFLYNMMGRLYFRKRWDFRYQEVVKYINPGESVLELCVGDGVLSTYLNSNKYIGFEFNRTFVNYGIRKKRNLVLADILSHPFPESDVIIMISSFYHFIHNARVIWDKMKNSCRKRIVICENVACLSTSSNKWLNMLGRAISMAHNGTGTDRWTKEEICGFLKENNFSKIYCKNNYIFGVWDKF